MSQGGDDAILSREQLVEDDIACLRRLEDLGLLDLDASYRPGRMMFRLIAHMPAGYVDEAGELRDKDRWSCDIVLEADYPASPPSVQLSAGQVVPDNEFFVERRGGLLPLGGRPHWRPPPSLAAANRRAGDCALIFLWSVNPEIMASMMAEHAESFRAPPLGGLAVTALLFAEADSLIERLRAEDEAPPRDTAVDPVAPPRRKFVIRDEQPQAGVKTESRPAAYQLIAQPRDVEPANPVYLGRSALREIFDHIEWDQRTERNVREQGGVLVGLRCRDADSGEEFVRVTNALPVQGEERSSVYVKFDHAAWSALLHELDLRKEAQAIDPDAVIVGWYHTHPNGLDCFMSGTDRTTQRSVFHRPWNYALVLNPHRKIIASFVGAESEPCAAAVLE